MQARQGESVQEIDVKKTAELEEKFDPEMRFRPLAPHGALIVGVLLIVLSCFHYYTAGFGLLRETTHRGVHLAFVLGLVFLVFPMRKALLERGRRAAWHSPGGVPLTDWAMAIAIAVSVLYIPWIFDDLAFRVGNPLPLDVVDGLGAGRPAARSHAAGDGLAAAGDRAGLHELRAVGPGLSRACCSIRARRGRTSSTTST